ncbi:SLC13 family permease [Streptomyces sp. NPDC060011]|uniref:SLC13 family permease n=1 Tax=unclassified Streptomyces TaxID=2593676 RepID=UPI0036BB4DB7
MAPQRTRHRYATQRSTTGPSPRPGPAASARRSSTTSSGRSRSRPGGTRGHQEPRLLVQGLIVLALVVAGFVLHPVLRYEPSIVALLGAGLLIAVSSAETGEVLSEVEWPTLAFFAGLFIMIGGLIDTAHHPLAVHQIGLVVTAATVTISLIYVWLRYFALAA